MDKTIGKSIGVLLLVAGTTFFAEGRDHNATWAWALGATIQLIGWLIIFEY